MRRSKATLLAALFVLAAASSSANADALSLSTSRFTAVSNGPLTFEAGGTRVNCNVTLSGSFRSGTIETTTGTSIGRATGSTLSGCSGVTLLGPTAERPWEVKYDSVEGALPDGARALNVRLSGFAASVESFGRGCLYSGEPTASTVLSSTYEVGINPFTFRNIRFTPNTINRASGEALCPATMSVAGSLELEAQAQVRFEPFLQWTGGGPIFEFGRQTIGNGLQWYTAEVTLINRTGTALTTREIRVVTGSVERFRYRGLTGSDFIPHNGEKTFRIEFNPTAAPEVRSGIVIDMTNGRGHAIVIRGSGQ